MTQPQSSVLIFDPQAVRALDVEGLLTTILNVRVVATHAAMDFDRAWRTGAFAFALADLSLRDTFIPLWRTSAIVWVSDNAHQFGVALGLHLRRPLLAADIASLAYLLTAP